MAEPAAAAAEIAVALAPLTAAPDRAGVFFDLDGTLAPIVGRPEQAAVPARTLGLLELIAGRYALSGIVTGRQAAEARQILGIESLTYIGNHGFELLPPGAAEAVPAPALVGHEDDAAGFAAGLDSELVAAAGLRIEDKGAIVALHWRGAEDEGAAEDLARTTAERADRDGLFAHWGRKVLELRPAVELDKGAGLGSVLASADLDAAFYAGDDRTDVDAFRRLEEMRSAGELDAVVRVAVVAAETPPEVADAADISVAGPKQFVAVLEGLA